MENQKIRLAVRTLLGVKHPKFKPDSKTSEDAVYAYNLLANIFGSIAIVGTSAKASAYPVEIEIYDLGTGRLHPTGEKFKLSEFLISMMTLSKTTAEKPVSKATMRQMCTPFAPEARTYLTAAAHAGVFTTLALKMTKLGNKEPQVCFDFSKGLDLLSMTRSEAAVIQTMHQRTFRTEGAKSVFEAQASIGENSVEI